MAEASNGGGPSRLRVGLRFSFESGREEREREMALYAYMWVKIKRATTTQK